MKGSVTTSGTSTIAPTRGRPGAASASRRPSTASRVGPAGSRAATARRNDVRRSLPSESSHRPAGSCAAPPEGIDIRAVDTQAVDVTAPMSRSHASCEPHHRAASTGPTTPPSSSRPRDPLRQSRRPPTAHGASSSCNAGIALIADVATRYRSSTNPDIPPREIGRHGTLLGVVDPVSIQTVEAVIQPGMSLVLYTDGVTGRHVVSLHGDFTGTANGQQVSTTPTLG